MQEHLCIYRARGMQSAPFPNQRGTWQPGDFSLHFVGMSNVNKYAGCRQFLETGTVRWLPGVGGWIRSASLLSPPRPRWAGVPFAISCWDTILSAG